VKIELPSLKTVDTSNADYVDFRALCREDGSVLYRGVGCEACTSTGYLERTGIFEWLVVDDDIHELILQRADLKEIRKVAKDMEMKTPLESWLEKVRRGITTLHEIYRII